MLQIKNDQLEVSIDETGAQLTHVCNLQAGFDYLWSGEQWRNMRHCFFQQ